MAEPSESGVHLSRMPPPAEIITQFERREVPLSSWRTADGYQAHHVAGDHFWLFWPRADEAHRPTRHLTLGDVREAIAWGRRRDAK